MPTSSCSTGRSPTFVRRPGRRHDQAPIALLPPARPRRDPRRARHGRAHAALPARRAAARALLLVRAARGAAADRRHDDRHRSAGGSPPRSGSTRRGELADADDRASCRASPRRSAATRAHRRTSIRSAQLERVLRHRLGDAELLRRGTRSRSLGGVLSEQTSSQPVGMVLGTEDATPLDFWVAIEPDAVSCSSTTSCSSDTAVPGAGDVRISGVVDMVRARHEGSRFDSDVFLAEQGVLPVEIARSAHVVSHAVRAGDLRAAAAGRPRRPRPRPRPRRGAVLRPDGAAARRRASRATASRSTSTSPSSTAAAART